MHIRKAQKKDIPEISDLFVETVLKVNNQDYTSEQLNQWADKGRNSQSWNERFKTFDHYVCLINNVIVGFTSMNTNGFINAMFVSKNHQRIGVAQSLLCHLMVICSHSKITEMEADVSITAKPFFERNGFYIVKEQQVELNGIHLTNYKMKKTF